MPYSRPGRFDLLISKGLNVVEELGIHLDQANKPIDLSTYTARAAFKAVNGASTSILELTNGAGITLGANGLITIRLTAAQSNLFDAGKDGLWSVIVIDQAGAKEAAFFGSFTTIFATTL